MSDTYNSKMSIFGGVDEINKGTLIKDVHQGKVLGNCYIMVAISILSRYPDLLKQIFKMDENASFKDYLVNQSGEYTL